VLLPGYQPVDEAAQLVVRPQNKLFARSPKPGFKVAVEKGIELHVNDKLTIRLKLEVGQVTESVTVEAEAVSVETQTSSIGLDWAGLGLTSSGLR